MVRARSFIIIIVFMLAAGVLAVQAAEKADSTGGATVEQILKGIEHRYSGKGFTASFFQESILKAMQMTDTAEGRLTVERPGKMRWEYVVPDSQTIITDGKSMWIYRPSDNQVMVGQAPEYFGNGKGAGFLSDVRQIRKSFSLSQLPAESSKYFRLKLIPHKPTADLADIILSVAVESYQIDQVVTHNTYGDETRFVLSDYQFNIDPDDALFTFTIPEGVDVVKMDRM